jgi:MFS family permease
MAMQDGLDANHPVLVDVSKEERRRILVSGAIGTMIEWYDFFLYGFVSPLVFDKLFFPKFDPKIGMIAVFATFAVGFLARPLGGVIFGHFGDRFGRKSVLLVTLLLMGVATMLIGLLPTYASAGIVAPLGLVLLRFLQGFALGGEAIAAGLMAIESALHGRRGFTAAIIQAAGPFGVAFASLSALLIARLSEQDLLSWGWRIPFVLSAVLVLVGLYLRIRVVETPFFRASADRGELVKVPAFEAMRLYPGPIAAVLLTELAASSFFYLTTIFSLSFATHEAGVPREVITQSVLFANLLAFVMIPLFGAWSDSTGRLPIMVTGAVLAGLSMLVFYPVIRTGEPFLITLALLAAVGIIHPMMYGPSASFYPEQFPTRVRFSGVVIGKQLGSLLGGGMAPLIASALYAWSGATLAITCYFAVLAAACVTALSIARETSAQGLGKIAQPDSI